MTPILLLSLLTTAPLENVVAADPIAWLEVPALGRSVGQLESSQLKPLVALLLSRQSRTLLQSANASRLLAAAYGSPTASADWVVAMEPGSALGPLRNATRDWILRQGFTAKAGRAATIDEFARGDESMALRSADSLLGVASDPARLRAMAGVAAKPLGATDGYRRLSSTPADLRGAIDVQRFYGALAVSSFGRTLAGLIDRLGLLETPSASVTATVDRRKGVRSRLEVQFGPAVPKGLRTVVGPPLVPARPAMLPSAAAGYIRVSLHPKRLYELAQILANYLRPIEASLVRANIDAIEGRLGKRLGDDILGDGGQTWTLYFAQGGDEGAPVLLADIADSSAATAFLKEIVQLLPALAPGVEARLGSTGAAQVYTVTANKREIVALGVRQGTLIVAAKAALVRAALNVKPAVDSPIDEPPALAYGRLGTAALRTCLRATLAGRYLLGAANARGMNETQVASALGAVAFDLAPVDGGWAMNFEMRP